MDASLSPCPVPSEQQPLNEYNELRQSCFFRWATVAAHKYLLTMGVIWSLSLLLVWPIAAVSFVPAKHPLEFGLSSMGGASLILVLPLLRLYLGWTYIRNRLFSETIFYEESGWYDGQYWEKSAEMLARDRLIVTYEIQPILRRLELTFGGLALLLLSGNLLWFWH